MTTRYAAPAAPLATWHTGYVTVEIWSHRVRLRPVRRNRHWIAECEMDGQFPGQPSCAFRHEYPNRAQARQAADAHLIYTHVTGGSKCGNPLNTTGNGASRKSGCDACRAIRRINREGQDAP